MAMRDTPTLTRLRPRYESANIRTWIGFRQFMSMAQEAVLAWFRERDAGPQALYRRYELELSVVDSSVLLPAVLEVDDEVVALARSAGSGVFEVRLRVAREATEVTVLRGRVRVMLVHRDAAHVRPHVPQWLAPMVVPGVPAESLAPEPAAFGWDWRVRYPDCHFSSRVQHGGYVRVLEETVDRFLADRGICIPRLLAERGWIPVVSRARVRLLGDAHMDDEVRTSFTVGEVIKDRAFNGRMDCHVTGRGAPRAVATATILHGYAISAGAAAGTLAELDDATVKALLGGVAP